MTDKIVYLMRGLPSCGKSHTAKQLVADGGIICETDDFFYSARGEPTESYNYDSNRLDEAREWNLQRYKGALNQGVSPIVVDRGNGCNAETQEYIVAAHKLGYHVEFREPDSPWWQELRVLLKYKQYIAAELFDRWAEALAERSQETHRVPVKTIRHWMQSWRSELTVEDVLDV